MPTPIILKTCAALLDSLDIYYSFEIGKGYNSGCANNRANTVFIYYDDTLFPDNYICDARIASIVCHEIEHIMCYRKGIYPIYHNKILPTQSKTWLCDFKRTAWKAERYVDQLGYVRFYELMNDKFSHSYPKGVSACYSCVYMDTTKSFSGVRSIMKHITTIENMYKNLGRNGLSRIMVEHGNDILTKKLRNLTLS